MENQPKAMNQIFIVNAWRWGSRSNHSYLVGVYTDEKTAIDVAEKHTSWRGGKYAVTVERVIVDSGDGWDVDADIEIIHRTKSLMDQNDVQLSIKSPQ